MPYTPTNFSTTAVINADTLFQNYDDEVRVLMSDVGNYLTEEMVKVYTETGTIVTDGIKVNSVETIEDLATQDGVVFKTIIVKDLNRGGTFVWSSTGTANGGTVFAGATGYWARQYSGTVNVKWFGAKGDGFTDDTAIFSLIQLEYSNSIIELNGLVYLVDFYPTNNKYRNGYFRIGIDIFKADIDDTTISDKNDTKGLQAAYTGGVNNTPTTTGRTTEDQALLLASQNCRSEFIRAVNIGSIYSWAYGNISGNYSSRQCVAGAPQTANIASEECESYGFRGSNIASHYCETFGSGVNISSRYSAATAVKHSVNIASVSANAGQGKNARLTTTVSSGVITSVNIVDGGIDYLNGESILFYDRVSNGDGAIATITTDGSGTITGVTITNGGAGYGDTVDAVVECSGDYSANIATTNGCKTTAEASANIASNACKVNDIRSANIASTSSVINGFTSSNVASENANVNGNISANLASTASTVNGDLSVVIGGNICEANGTQSVVFGRRTINNENRSIAFGDSSSGVASTANTKFKVLSNGNVKVSGTFSGGTIFTDYAEYFENLINSEIKLGTIVALEGDKVRIADTGDDILGVVSATAVIKGGDTSFSWQGRYLYSDYGEPIMEEVLMVSFTIENKVYDGRVADFLEEFKVDSLDNIIESPNYYVEFVQKENENYDSSIENIPRSERPTEWTCVGLLGQLFVDIDDTVYVGDYICPNKGIGTKSDTETRLKVMSINNSIAKCLLR